MALLWRKGIFQVGRDASELGGLGRTPPLGSEEELGDQSVGPVALDGRPAATARVEPS